MNGSPYSYDLNGNLISGGGRAPVWDAANRVTQVGATQFSYDGFGERLKKTTGSSTSLYPLGDDYEIRNGEVTKYISVEGLGVIAKRVGDMNACAYGYGDPVNGTDRSGLVVCHFDPCDEGTENKFGLSTQAADPPIGIVWNGERWVYTTVTAGGAVFAPWVLADLLGGGSSSSSSGTGAGSSTGFRDARRAERELTIPAIEVPPLPPTGGGVPPTGAPAGAGAGSSTGPTIVDKTVGYFLNATRVPARLIDSWFPEHHRNNWFDRALDSVSPEEEMLLGVAGSLAGGPKLGAGRVRSASLPRFPGVRDHALRHSDLPWRTYYVRALHNIETGHPFMIRHGGEFKYVYLTRTGPNSFIFTSTSLNGRTILTHLPEVNTLYLRNKGMTLPIGF